MTIPFSGASHCWFCGKQLQLIPLSWRTSTDTFYFKHYTDPVGNLHRVHGECLKNEQREAERAGENFK